MMIIGYCCYYALMLLFQAHHHQCIIVLLLFSFINASVAHRPPINAAHQQQSDDLFDQKQSNNNAQFSKWNNPSMQTPPLWFRHHHRPYLHNNDNNRHKIKTTPIDDGRDQQLPNSMIMHRYNQQQHRHMQKQQHYRLHPPSVRIQHHPKTVDHKASSTMNRLNKQHQLPATPSTLRAQPIPLFMRHDDNKLQATANNNRHLDHMDMTHRNQQWPMIKTSCEWCWWYQSTAT